MFSCEIYESFKNTFLQSTSGGCFYNHKDVFSDLSTDIYGNGYIFFIHFLSNWNIVFQNLIILKKRVLYYEFLISDSNFMGFNQI